MIRPLGFAVSALVWGWLGCSPMEGRATPVVLARGGKPAATIVVPAQAPTRLGEAAAQLQEYVRKLCGVELPIHRDGKPVAGTGVYIGRCEPSLDTDPPPASLNPESYTLRVRDGNLFFAARYPTATYYAVVSFIEEALGVRWFAPGATWEFVPPGVPGELSVEAKDHVKSPDTSPRFWTGHNFGEEYEAWNRHNKTYNSEHAPRGNFQNHLYRVFPPSKYAKTHPEYYPLIEGNRWIPEENFRYWRPCESNPDVIRLTVEAARRFFDEHPEADSFSLGMDDISHICGCAQCRALDPHPDSYEHREFADRHYKFVNAVAREIAKTHPQRFIGTLIYDITRQPPLTVPRLEDNIFGFMTEVSAQWCLPGHKQADQDLTREWARRCKHLSRYDYFGLGTFTPRYYPHAMAEQIRFDKSLGFEGMYSEINTFLPHTAPMIWAFAKLEWDASLDIDKLLAEFMTRMFGQAAPAMSRYYDLLEQAWNDPPPGRTNWEHRAIFTQALAIKPEAVVRGLALLDEAAAQAEPGLVRVRIATIRAALQYSGYAIQAYALSEKVIATPVTNAAQAAAVTRDAERILRLSVEREPFWEAAMQRQDLLGMSLRGLNGKNYLMIGRAGDLERGAVVGGLRVLDWYRHEAPAEFATVAAPLTAAGGGDLSNPLRAWLAFEGAGRKPVNLLTNAGFELAAEPARVSTPGGNPDQPAGWSTYSLSVGARLWREPQAGRNGSAGVCISGVHSASYLQTHDVKPGERYLCVAYVRSRPEGTDAGGYLAVRFQKPDGSWHPRTDKEPQVSMIAQPGWQPLLTLATVPEGAGRIVVLICAKNQPKDATVLFDDVGLYRLAEGER